MLYNLNSYLNKAFKGVLKVNTIANIIGILFILFEL